MIAYCIKSTGTMATTVVLINAIYSQANSDIVKVWIEAVDRSFLGGLLHPLSCETQLNRHKQNGRHVNMTSCQQGTPRKSHQSFWR